MTDISNLLDKLSERIPRIRMTRQLLIAGNCMAILILGLSFVRPHIETILDVLLVPCIIFGCYFGYSVMVFRKENRKLFEESNRE